MVDNQGWCEHQVNARGSSKFLIIVFIIGLEFRGFKNLSVLMALLMIMIVKINFSLGFDKMIIKQTNFKSSKSYK